MPVVFRKIIVTNPPAKHHKFLFGPPRSTRWTLHEHLLFQRRLCRKGVAVMSTQNPRVKVLMCLGPRVFYILVPDWDSAPNHNRQTAASNASVNTHSPFLLVGDYAPNPAERRIHSAAARSANAFLEGTKTPPHRTPF